MAYADYIHCETCDCKLVYDGYGNARDDLQATYGIPEEKYSQPLICPACLKKERETRKETQ